MTDDERREEATPQSDENGDTSETSVASDIDPLKRWADPESRWGDPERDLPKIPRVRIPGQETEQSLGDELRDEGLDLTGNADPEQSRLFWASVVFANVGLAGLALGVMLVYFRGQLWVGGGLILLGVLALSRVYAIYREFTERDWSGDADADGTDADPDGRDTDTADTEATTDDPADDDERNR